MGFDFDGTPRLYQTDPSGTYHAWKANAIGRGAKSVREFLEKNYTDEAIETDDLTIKLVIKALLEVVQSGGKNIELAVMRRDQPLKILNPAARPSRHPTCRWADTAEQLSPAG